MTPKILIIDDDALVCKSLEKVIKKFNYDVDICLEADKALDKIKRIEPDIILLDIYLSGSISGLDLLSEIQEKYPKIPVIMITAFADVNIAVDAMKRGAFDFLLKPINTEHLKLVLEKCEKHLNLQVRVNKLGELLAGEKITREFFGKSKKIIRLVNEVEMLAKSDTTILLEGESGVGKEVFARYIHQQSNRADKPFIAINCGTIPKDLAESELFGHEKGAFTGAASKTKAGKFELANNGTILLDEIGELTLDLQVKLLRVLQEKKFYRLGGEREISVDVRIIAATNKSLEEEVKKGNFREDLFYRLNVAKILIPPLRERKDDIPVLVYSFLNEFSNKFNKQVVSISDDAMELLVKQPWRGNIRELRNAIERAVLIANGKELKKSHFHFLVSADKDLDDDFTGYLLKIPPEGIKVDVVLRDLILKTLEITNGNQVKAAKILGLSRSKLRYRMEQLDIEVTKKIG